MKLDYCPRCGNKTFKAGDFKPWACKHCGFVLFQNTAAAAGVFLMDRDQRVLFVVRAKEPSRGKLGLPGGFLDAGETAEEGLRREVLEEVGLELSEVRYFCSCPNQYEYKGLTYHTLDLYFIAEIEYPISLRPLDEVDELVWKKIEDVTDDEIAFQSLKNAVAEFKQRFC